MRRRRKRCQGSCQTARACATGGTARPRAWSGCAAIMALHSCYCGRAVLCACGAVLHVTLMLSRSHHSLWTGCFERAMLVRAARTATGTAEDLTGSQNVLLWKQPCCWIRAHAGCAAAVRLQQRGQRQRGRRAACAAAARDSRKQAAAHARVVTHVPEHARKPAVVGAHRSTAAVRLVTRTVSWHLAPGPECQELQVQLAS